MNNLQIDDILRNDDVGRVLYRGVYASDTLPQCRSGAYVCNTAPSSHPGEHWVAFFCTEHTVDYFDSYGRKPSTSVLSALKGKEITCNKLCLQSPFSSVCGQYCIYYLLQRMRNESMSVIVNQFDDNVDYNDQLVYDFVRMHFDLNELSIIDTTGLLVQLALPRG